MFRFDFQPMRGFDLFVTGRSHFLLSEGLLFNNVMITLTSARWSARIVELASGLYNSKETNYKIISKMQFVPF